MQLSTLGINHHTAPLEMRERAAIAAEHMDDAIKDVVASAGVSEATILSTCNRTEIYCGSANEEIRVLDWLSEYQGLPRTEMQPFVYRHDNRDAVNHAFRVASGLDSMVLGEPQILGQMKQAFSAANRLGATGKVLNRLFQHTFSVAKQVRTDTAVGANAVSVAYAAVDLAKRIFTDLCEQTVLLIGAGETIELVARHLRQQGVKRIIVANRSIERAQRLIDDLTGDALGEAISLAEIPLRLADADILVASTASTLPILGKGAVERAIKARKHQPMYMVDLAVPRDIEPEVGALRDVYLYTVDDLQSVVADNQRSRQEAAAEAEKIIDLQVVRFMRWMRSLESVPTIKTLRMQMGEITAEELARSKRRLHAGDDPEQVLENLAHALTNKYLHQPSQGLRDAEADGNTSLIAAAKKLFDL